MATEQPNDPNTGGTGINSRDQVFAPTFVGGQTDPSSGIIVPSNKNNAAIAPSAASSIAPSSAPQSPPAVVPTAAPATAQAPQLATTQLGSLGNDTPTAQAQPAATQKTPGFGDIAKSFAPTAGALLGETLVSPAVASTLGLGAVNSAAQSVLGSAAGGSIGSAAASTGLGAIGDGASAVAGFGGATAGDVAGDVAGSAAGGVAGGAISSILGFALPGVGAAVGGLIAGEKPLQAVEQGAGAAVGFAIGNAILPGIGGILGGAAGGALVSLFCHAAGTFIRMKDGSRKFIEDLRIGDDVFLGGKVLGRGEVLSGNLFHYRGTIVNGMHAVFEGGRWVRVRDANHYGAIAGLDCVFPIVTEHHLLACEHYICADFAETDDVEVSPAQRLELLNLMVDRNNRLLTAERLIDVRRKTAA